MSGFETGYRPIEDYALIGDCHGAALVSREGSIDWACLGRFDADPTFLSLLDAEKGGTFSIRPEGPFWSDRAYLHDTAIVATAFGTDTGQVTLRDFMPVGRRPGCSTYDYVTLQAPHWIVRNVECTSGRMRLCLRFRPSRDWAERPDSLTARDGLVEAESGTVLHHQLGAVSVDGDIAEAVFEISAGERLSFVCAGSRAANDPLARAARLFDVTRAFWREWTAFCRYEGQHRDMVRRSAITLKLMTYAPSGAFVAAPTTSLPEAIEGARNWDYRFCWLRDSALALYALSVAGYGGEARRFSDFLVGVGTGELGVPQIMYGVDGRSALDERVFPHLAGYRQSRPVRAGNAAHDQRQLDVYGALLDWADVFRAIGGRIDDRTKEMLSDIANFVAEHWPEPDHGLWEIRDTPRHHVHSRVMSWVALDRAIRLIGARNHWVEARDAVAAEIRDRGFVPGGHMVQAYGTRGIDASALLAPMMGFEMTTAALDATIGAVESQLRRGDFVHRYGTEDGLPGGEGAFLICAFWLVDAMLVAGRATEAEELFDRLVKRANDVGLFAEEIDTADGAFLGNFPQAFTHLALIASASHLQLCSGEGCGAMQGTHADRVDRLVSATLGWRGIVSALAARRRLGRVTSSRASMMDDGADADDNA